MGGLLCPWPCSFVGWAGRPLSGQGEIIGLWARNASYFVYGGSSHMVRVGLYFGPRAGSQAHKQEVFWTESFFLGGKLLGWQESFYLVVSGSFWDARQEDSSSLGHRREAHFEEASGNVGFS